MPRTKPKPQTLRKPPRRRLTFEEFVEWLDEDTWAEGVDGQESRLRDRGDKRAEYEAAGIPEYWLIDPERREVELHRLDERGRYRPGESDEAGWYRSEVIPGFRLRAERLWQEPLPSPLTVLAELLALPPWPLVPSSCG